MRIVHISTSVIGGAGLAAYRLHKTMLKNNFESVLYSQNFEDEKQFCFKIEITRPKKIIDKSKNYLYNRLNNYINKKYKLFNFEHYSTLRTLYRIDKYCKKGDIIILHWVADFLDYESFFNNIDKNTNIFIYVHDFNVIQGKLHTLFDRNKIIGEPLERIENYYQSKKFSYYSQLNNLKIIANSNFTQRIINESGFFSRNSVFNVPLGLPVDELKTMDKKSTKKLLGFSESDFLILICSNVLEIERKGFDRIMKIFNKFKSIPNIKFIGLGRVTNNLLINHTNFFSFNTWDPLVKSQIFSASDVTISASYEETFGQTIIESYTCSTPVIVYNNPALPELVQHHETGFIAEDDDDVYKYINLLYDDPILKNEMAKSAREIFLKKYTSTIQLKKLREVLNYKYNLC